MCITAKHVQCFTLFVCHGLCCKCTLLYTTVAMYAIVLYSVHVHCCIHIFSVLYWFEIASPPKKLSVPCFNDFKDICDENVTIIIIIFIIYKAQYPNMLKVLYNKI